MLSKKAPRVLPLKMALMVKDVNQKGQDFLKVYYELEDLFMELSFLEEESLNALDDQYLPENFNFENELNRLYSRSVEKLNEWREALNSLRPEYKEWASMQSSISPSLKLNDHIDIFEPSLESIVIDSRQLLKSINGYVGASDDVTALKNLPPHTVTADELRSEINPLLESANTRQEKADVSIDKLYFFRDLLLNIHSVNDFNAFTSLMDLFDEICFAVEDDWGAYYEAVEQLHLRVYEWATPQQKWNHPVISEITFRAAPHAGFLETNQVLIDVISQCSSHFEKLEKRLNVSSKEENLIRFLTRRAAHERHNFLSSMERLYDFYTKISCPDSAVYEASSDNWSHYRTVRQNILRNYRDFRKYTQMLIDNYNNAVDSGLALRTANSVQIEELLNYYRGNIICLKRNMRRMLRWSRKRIKRMEGRKSII